jgi:phage gp29-like protein
MKIKITEERISIIFLSVIMATLGSVITFQTFEDVQATGGAGEIKGLIDPIIDRAITALQSNNTELALEEIQTLKQELDDTFAVDSEEEKDKDE